MKLLVSRIKLLFLKIKLLFIESDSFGYFSGHKKAAFRAAFLYSNKAIIHFSDCRDEDDARDVHPCRDVHDAQDALHNLPVSPAAHGATA